jgi:hypothetical protein
MNIARKIQIAATAVLVNGAVALLSMSPQVAIADSCEPQVICITEDICYSVELITLWCESNAPGCTMQNHFCIYPSFNGFGCPEDQGALACTYI